jgi:hypothetical protein
MNVNEAPTSPLHPLLAERLSEFNLLPTTTHPNYFGRPGQLHAETLAMSEALWARQSALGRFLTFEDIEAIKLDVRYVNGGRAMPRCSRCMFMTEGASITPALRAEELRQADDIISGRWAEARPF